MNAPCSPQETREHESLKIGRKIGRDPLNALRQRCSAGVKSFASCGESFPAKMPRPAYHAVVSQLRLLPVLGESRGANRVGAVHQDHPCMRGMVNDQRLLNEGNTHLSFKQNRAPRLKDTGNALEPLQRHRARSIRPGILAPVHRLYLAGAPTACNAASVDSASAATS
jgi:hypothetical protein